MTKKIQMPNDLISIDDALKVIEVMEKDDPRYTEMKSILQDFKAAADKTFANSQEPKTELTAEERQYLLSSFLFSLVESHGKMNTSQDYKPTFTVNQLDRLGEKGVMIMVFLNKFCEDNLDNMNILLYALSEKFSILDADDLKYVKGGYAKINFDTVLSNLRGIDKNALKAYKPEILPSHKPALGLTEKGWANLKLGKNAHAPKITRRHSPHKPTK